ncbi:MAG: glycosyltransferase [Myxococcota bacterium]
MGARNLFLLTEGFDETVIDSQVVDSVVALGAEGVPLDVLSLVDTRNWLARREYYLERRRAIAERTGTRVWILPVVRKTDPAGLFVALPLIAAALGLSGLRRSVVHARGDWAGRIGAVAARALPGVSLLYDCRGDGEAELRRELERTGQTGDDAARQVERLCNARARAVQDADHTLCVSAPLRELLVERHGLAGDHCTVVPCAADEQKFRPDPVARARRRAALGLEDRFVLVYPGRFGRWHYSEETMRVAAGVLEAHADAFFLVLTPDGDVAREMAARQLPEGRFRIEQAAHHEVPEFLQAADLGVLLRASDPINRVACPTKFAEFVMTGLPVLISDEIGDCSSFVRTHGAGAVLRDPDPRAAADAVAALRGEPGTELRERVAAAGLEQFSRQRHAARLAPLYRRLGSARSSE